MAWYTGPILPPITTGGIEFWLDEELLLTVQMDDVSFALVEGMYVKYVNLAGVEEEHRIGDVRLSLTESETGGRPASPPDPPIPGSIVLTPCIRVELQIP